MRNRNDDPATLAEVVRRLLTIRDRLGRTAFREACAKSLVAIGGAALAQAEEKARRRARRKPSSNVVMFRPRRDDANRSPEGQPGGQG